MDAIKQENGGNEAAPSSSSGSSSSALNGGFSAGPADGDLLKDIRFQAYSNDGTDECLRALVDLKNIFSKQLPKMPKEYIVRLVFDKRHTSLAIERGDKIIGGVCYRAYRDQRFGEIAFLAISGTEQVRGFGTILMNALKTHVQREGLEYFLTYADNYAIGYFQKQGFSKNVNMPKHRWAGFIKDYDGGTLMECYIHPGMDYGHVKYIVGMQRAFVTERAMQRSTSHVEYNGLELFRAGNRLTSILDIPGVQEAGWTPLQLYRGNTERDRNNMRNKLTNQILAEIGRVDRAPFGQPFLNPVDIEGYDEIVKDPIDLRLMRERAKTGDYYRTKDMFMADMRRMVSNCKKFNAVGTQVHQCAQQIEAILPSIDSNLTKAISP